MVESAFAEFGLSTTSVFDAEVFEHVANTVEERINTSDVQNNVTETMQPSQQKIAAENNNLKDKEAEAFQPVQPEIAVSELPEGERETADQIFSAASVHEIDSKILAVNVAWPDPGSQEDETELRKVWSDSTGSR